MDPCVIVAVTSGLGNQMFQYAAGRALSIRLGLPLLLDLTWFRGGHGYTPREYGLGVFKLSAQTATTAQLRAVMRNDFDRRFGLVPPSEIFAIVREPRQQYWPEFHQIGGPTYIQGFWQSPRYFESAAGVIRRDLAFPEFSSPRARDLAADIRASENSVSIHVRRGDYVAIPALVKMWGGIRTPEYYAGAIRRVARHGGQIKLYLFSDDPVWVRSNFDTHGYPSVVVDVPEHVLEPHHDLLLMSLARHHIIANSTFSWWGAWLGPQGDRIVVAPQRWIASETPAESAKRARLPATWITL